MQPKSEALASRPSGVPVSSSRDSVADEVARQLGPSKSRVSASGDVLVSSSRSVRLSATGTGDDTLQCRVLLRTVSGDRGHDPHGSVSLV